MPLLAKISLPAASAAADAVCAQLDGGFLRLYEGPRPASANSPLTGQTLLAELTFGTPAFAAAVDGIALATPITPTTAVGTGGASWFRAVTAGETTMFDGTVGETGSDSNIELNSVSIVAPGPVAIASFSYQQAESSC